VGVDANGPTVRDCEASESGVIVMGSPGLFGGYRQPDQNEAQRVAEGWFSAGDLGRLDEEG
jgi:long-subunit acyl-CoA synthetase (AMP-forming)